MAKQRAHDRYRAQPAVRRIVVVKGDDAHSYTIRPWLAALFSGFGILIALGFIGSTAYLAFRDNLISASVSRNADLQQAYEDRIASLRSEIDKIASRQLLEQVAYDDKVERLLSAQRALDDRQRAVSGLIEQARSSGLLAGADAKGDQRADLGAPADGAAAYAPDPAEAIDRSFAALTGTPDGDGGERDTRPDLKRMAEDLARMNAEQTSAVVAIRTAALARADKVERIVKKLGVTLKPPADAPRAASDADAVGGPYIPINGPEALAAAMEDAAAAFGRLQHLKSAVDLLPVVEPLAGAAVTSNFGSRSDPFLGSSAFHAGIDFRAPTGRPVTATAAGRVINAGRNGGYGNLIEIDHGKGLTTRYAHLSRIDVKVGERVARGQVVGRVGSTGRSTGPHLHYETRVDGTAVNPLAYLKAGREIRSLLN
ncbi:M23 family metallopeptidase [Mongoliimonas terrestris]|uniref:M23 family metallopeptidase n=1 Tax=Mongoliimonas terrestris TaxID=1709001 RepID=UPI0009495B03|nr:M23 family metallopeptidase [Mongoliimonas terrestris]